MEVLLLDHYLEKLYYIGYVFVYGTANFYHKGNMQTGISKNNKKLV